MEKIDKSTKGVDYDKIIQDFLPHESESEYMEGSEGRAFFLGDDYVIKKFTDKEKLDIEGLYCYYDEMLKLHEMGINLPQFYNYFVSDKRDFYILQERIKGTSLRVDYIDCFYPKVADLCSKEEFNKALKTPENYKALFSEITLRYANNFLEVNSLFDSVSDKELEKFVVGVFNMFTMGKYSLPDLNSSNIFVTDKGLYNIDNSVTGDWSWNRKKKISEDKKRIKAFYELFDLFEENDILFEFMMTYFDTKQVSHRHGKLGGELDKIISKNIEICQNIAIRMGKIVKRILDDPRIIDEKALHNIYLKLTKIFPKENAINMSENLNQIFER